LSAAAVIEAGVLALVLVQAAAKRAIGTSDTTKGERIAI
jgi:hypothetical protein